MAAQFGDFRWLAIGEQCTGLVVPQGSVSENTLEEVLKLQASYKDGETWLSF